MDRVEEIRKHLAENERYLYTGRDMWMCRYRKDVPHLLSRVEELEKDRTIMANKLIIERGYQDELTAEVSRLRTKLERKDEKIAEIRNGAEF